MQEFLHETGKDHRQRSLCTLSDIRFKKKPALKNRLLKITISLFFPIPVSCIFGKSAVELLQLVFYAVVKNRVTDLYGYTT